LNSFAVDQGKTSSQGASALWRTSRFEIDLSKPKVMAIVNLTPDSFATHTMQADWAEHPISSHTQWIKGSLAHAQAQLKAGADILDIGAESTRPGATVVPLEEEWSRLEPILQEVVKWGVPISVDTYKPQIMARALDLGVDIINDIWALRQSQALEVLASFNAGICLMHMHANPQTMQVNPMSGDVVAQVSDFLAERVKACADQGIQRSRLILDPGVGFGKTVAQNFDLLHRQQKMLSAFEPLPFLIGWSRKSSLGAVTGLAVEDRVGASVVAAVLAIERGAQVVRVHDVAPTIEALKVWLHASGLTQS
jgi:dihydropteroate synthase